MILADTSIWIDHLNAGDSRLAWHLEQGQVLMHPFILGELACGNLQQRQQLLTLLQQLPQCPCATDAEVLYFIEQKRLMGQGIGYVDAHLLAATALGNAKGLWTRDRRLEKLAKTLGYAVQPNDPRDNLHEPEPPAFV